MSSLLYRKRRKSSTFHFLNLSKLTRFAIAVCTYTGLFVNGDPGLPERSVALTLNKITREMPKWLTQPTYAADDLSLPAISSSVGIESR